MLSVNKCLLCNGDRHEDESECPWIIAQRAVQREFELKQMKIRRIEIENGKVTKDVTSEYFRPVPWYVELQVNAASKPTDLKLILLVLGIALALLIGRVFFP